MGSPGGPISGLWVGSPSAEDEACLLQGHEPAWRLPEPIVRFSRLHVSAEKGDLARSSIRRLIPARGQSESAESDPADDPTMGGPPSERHGPGRFGPDVQSIHPRLDQLLRPLLQVGTIRSALSWTLRRIDAFLIRWARNKFKRLRPRPKGAREWLTRVVRSNPNLFVHWGFLHVNGRTSGAV